MPEYKFVWIVTHGEEVLAAFENEDDKNKFLLDRMFSPTRKYQGQEIDLNSVRATRVQLTR